MTSLRTITIRSLSCTHSISSGDPKMNDAVSGTLRSRAPACSRASTLSLNISVQIRSPCRVTSPRRAASGTAPMPAWMVAPSGTRSATLAPISADSSSIPGAGAVGRSPSASIITSTNDSGITASPWVHGIRSFTWATTSPPRRRTASIAAGRMFTSVPIDSFPSRGRVVCSSTASGGWKPAKSEGTRESRHGV